MQDLNGLLQTNSGWVLEVASNINDKGKITGMGVFNGEGHAFLLVPSIMPSHDDKRHAYQKSLNGNTITFSSLLSNNRKNEPHSNLWNERQRKSTALPPRPYLTAMRTDPQSVAPEELMAVIR